jgi:uncharacterized membrane protein
MSQNNQALTRRSFYQKITPVIFGVFLIVVILEAGLQLGGFVLFSTLDCRNKVSISKKKPY